MNENSPVVDPSQSATGQINYDYKTALSELLSYEDDGIETVAELVKKKDIEKLLMMIPPDFDLAEKNGVSMACLKVIKESIADI